MKEMLTLEEELAIIKELESFDTPTITNVVATYPGKATCLSLYHPWDTNWYTDDSLRAMYPELGHEAVELAKKYCDEDSYKFINGVLDRL